MQNIQANSSEFYIPYKMKISSFFPRHKKILPAPSASMCAKPGPSITLGTRSGIPRHGKADGRHEDSHERMHSIIVAESRHIIDDGLLPAPA